MNTNKKLNMTMLCDFYELTMGNGYFKAGYKDRITHFDLFFRSVPDKGGYAIAAGLEQVIEYIQDLHVEPEDIEYLRSRKMFDEGFLDYLANFKFTGDIFAVPEGTPVFPNEPILTVRAPAIQSQLLETYLLLTINHQSLIATKANRIVRAARGRCWSLAPAGPRGPAAPLTAPGRRLLAGAKERPAPSPTSSTACPQGAPWPTPGYRPLTPSMTPSAPTVRSIQITRSCWWTPTIP